MEKIDTDYKQRNLKSLAKLFKPFNRDWAPLMILRFFLGFPFSLSQSDTVTTEGEGQEGL